jgi:hypothetical protein
MQLLSLYNDLNQMNMFSDRVYKKNKDSEIHYHHLHIFAVSFSYLNQLHHHSQNMIILRPILKQLRLF